MIIPRGEAVRNFLYSATLRTLSQHARVTLLSVIQDEAFHARFDPYVERIIPLQEHPEARLVRSIRNLTQEAHFRWLWSEVARNRWEVWDHLNTSNGAWDPYDRAAPTALPLRKMAYSAFANRPALRTLTALENNLTLAMRPTRSFDALFAELKPDLVFNGSHIHGPAGILPVRVAHRMGIPTAGFVFSWDNLTSRSRILEPYDYYLVWHNRMKQQLLTIYPQLDPDRVVPVGTPQFDFHFQPEFILSREELARRIGFDPARPYVLYTTGIAGHFPGETGHVDFVIERLAACENRPQLVVRVYAKDSSGRFDPYRERYASSDHVFFPRMKWDDEWLMPEYDDLYEFTSMVHHAALGINAASTVSLELCIHDRPVINLGFDPPGSTIPHAFRWRRHIDFDHYRPVAESGAVMVASSEEELSAMIERGLNHPQAGSAARRRLLDTMFGGLLDGHAGERAADQLLAWSK
ncbi:MAG: hypothetical protein ACFB51_05515 [Anaerolineae bacterium]